MRKLFNAFRRDDSGAAMAEYAILVAFIALAAIVATGAVGTQLNLRFASVATALECKNNKPKTQQNTPGAVADANGDIPQSLQCQK